MVTEQTSEDVEGQKVMTYVLGTLHSLKEKGLLQGGWVQLSPEGMAEYRRLKESGYVPDQRLFVDCTKYLLSGPHEETDE